MVYYLFNTPYSPESFTRNILKCFYLPYTKDMLNSDNDLYTLSKKRHVNTCQHLLNIIRYKFAIDINTLHSIKNINFSDYKEINIGLLVEYIIYNTNMQNLTLEKLNVKFINHAVYNHPDYSEKKK
jgi:hypothetical protein